METIKSQNDDSAMKTFIEVLLFGGITYALINLSAFIASAAILGFVTTIGCLLILNQFKTALPLVLYYRKYVDMIVFLFTLFIGVTLGVTAAGAVVFASIFLSVYMRWGVRHLPLMKYEVQYIDTKFGIKIPTLRIVPASEPL